MIPSINKYLPAVFVKNTFALPEAPVYPEEGVVFRISAVPEYVTSSTSTALLLSCVAIAVVAETVPKDSLKKVVAPKRKLVNNTMDKRVNVFFMFHLDIYNLPEQSISRSD